MSVALNESERGMIAARIAILARGTNQYATKVDGSADPSTPASPMSRIDAGSLMGVSEATVMARIANMRQGERTDLRSKDRTLQSETGEGRRRA